MYHDSPVFVEVYVTYGPICSIFHLICTLVCKFITADWVKKKTEKTFFITAST